jgi:phosphatidylglycerophosphate synthase
MIPRQLRPKQIADTLTYVRLIIALLIVLVGISQGRHGLSTALLLLLAGWATDTLDGQLARKDLNSRKTWIGEHDIIVDVMLALSMMIYFSLSGFTPLWLTMFCALYLLAVTFILRGWTLYAMFIGLSYGTTLLVSFLYAQSLFYILALYIVIMLVTTWNHCWENILTFFSGFKNIGMRDTVKKKPV